MGKLQPPERPIVAGCPKPGAGPEDHPPQIPPRMKKKGPALPEKPPHMRASSQPPAREPLRPRVLNLEKPPGQEREVLVAACRAGRERPVEKRQREPAKLLKPTGGASAKDDPRKELSVLPLRGHLRLEDCLPPKRDFLHHSNPLWPPDDHASARSSRKTLGGRPQQQQPVLLIPRNLLAAWGSAPVSYALWTQREAPGGIRALRQNPLQRTSDVPSTARARSGSVTRSGSLTSQGSSGSDSGGETFPKSVLKKQRRANLGGSTSKGASSSAGSRRVDQKKNVTFNAFATVQLMEE